MPVCAVPCLEDAEARFNQWIADGKPIELCDELADLGSLAALALCAGQFQRWKAGALHAYGRFAGISVSAAEK